MRASIFAVVDLVLFTALALPGAADPARIVSLEECLQLGFANDAGLRADQLETQIAEARIHEMQGQYVPSVSLQGGYSRLSDVAPGSLSVALPAPIGSQTISFPPSLDNSTTFRLAVQQPLFTGQRIASSIRQAEALRDSSRENLSTSKLDLSYSITQAFWNLAKAKTQVQAIGQSVTQAESHLEDARKLLDQGMATNNDVLQAEMRLEDSRIDLASALSTEQIARVHLAIAIGLPWSADIDVPDTTSQSVAAPEQSLPALVDRALASRPEIRAARSRVTASEASVDLARAGLFPSLFLTGDYTLANPNQRVFPQTDQFVGTWSIGVLASIDVGRYAQVLAQTEQARGRLTQAEQSSRTIADAVTTDVIRAYITLTEAVGRLASLHQETAQAEENDRVTQERYRHGVALSSESLDAQVMLVRARLRESSALFDCEAAHAALQRAVGE
ncbi:MAG TPA: TolC family protein [Spirochaetia bacterium]|nr:TolC family protein [Spirochaetia bacterium]